MRVIELGTAPSHFDSEKHSHLLLPEAGCAARQLSDEFGIKKIRKINERPLLKMLDPQAGRNSFPQEFKLFLLERGMPSAEMLAAGIVSTSYSLGVESAGCVDPAGATATLQAVLKLPAELSIEWMFHLGYPMEYSKLEADFGRYSMTNSRTAETKFLLTPSVVELIAKNDSQIISYREL